MSLKILGLLLQYNIKNNVKVKITANALTKLDKFITILVKTIFINSCFVSLYNNRTKVTYSTTRQVVDIMLRGYEVNIAKFKQEYDQIMNPLTDVKIFPSFADIKPYIYRTDDLQKAIEQILQEIISLYGEDKITKGEQDIVYLITRFLICVIEVCILDIYMNVEANDLALKEIDRSKEYIIDDKVLCKVADLEEVTNLDNVLGSYEILKHNELEFEELEFDEIFIDDITDDNIEDEIRKIEDLKLKYKKYSFELNNLIV